MKWYKIKFHILCNVKKLFIKMFYRKEITIGEKTTWRRNFSIISEDGSISIGNNCFFNNDCSIASRGGITIGNGTLFGENVKIYDHNHRFADFALPIKEQGYSTGEVHIGSHCWIGSNVTILKGSNIGDNCVIAAGCVINSEVPSGTIVKIKQEKVIDLIRN